MAYRKTYRKTYRPRRKRIVGKKLQRTRKLIGQAPVTWAEKLASYIGPVGRIAGTVAQIAGLVNAEQNYKDTTITDQSVASDNNPLIYFNTIAEGDDVGARTGRSILGKDLQWRLRFQGDASSSVTSCAYAVVLDKRPDDAISSTASWTEVFNAASPTALINKNNSDRFVILKRGEFVLDDSAQNAGMVKGYVNLKGIHTKYADTTANATGIFANSIFLTAISDVPSSGAEPHLNGSVRYQYYDN